MIKQTTDKAAVVDTEFHWIPMTYRTPPRGAKVLVINDKRRSATLDNWTPDSDWTHWAPLPTFLKEKTDEH